MSKSFAVATLGCKVNLYESEAYFELLLLAGYTEVDFAEKADIYIINTCTVTNTAAAKSRQRIAQAKRHNPDALICVVGCYAQIAGDKLMAEYGIDLLLGSSQKHLLAQLIEEALINRGINAVDKVDNFVYEPLLVSSFSQQTRAFLKIQDGCNQFCSYCIIPYTRGRERSLELTAALNQAKKLVNYGHKEIVLAGIHTGRYLDSNNNNLVDLLRELLNIKDLERIRISSIEANEISIDLLELLQSNPKLAAHLHIPLQSGSDDILEKMNRSYTKADYAEKLCLIRKYLPEISISTDVIAGYPGESEELFQESQKFIRESKFSFLHVFPFSPRDSTPAASVKTQVSGQEKSKRVSALLKLSEELRESYLQGLIGKSVTVLAENYQEGLLRGYCSEYMEVEFTGQKHALNQLYNIRIIGKRAGKCYGSIEKG